MRTMFDSTTASDIPADAQMVGGYVDGRYRWSDADWALFPNAVKVRIAVFAETDDGHVLDVEWGCAAPEDVPGWVTERRAAGQMIPTVYINHDNWKAAWDACVDAGVALPLWWLASYDNDPTIPEGCVAKQYANEPLTGGHYDVSSVADFWPGVEGEDMAEYVTKEEFETYKKALQKQLDDEYVRRDQPLPEHGHHGEVVVK